MSVKEILRFGNQKLKRKSRKVEKIDDEVIDLIQNLKDTLNSTTGIGLAAPQIGVLKRVIYIDLKEGKGPIALINPSIVAKVGKEDGVEGCLSYPGFEGKLIRPKKVTVQGMDIKGYKVEHVADGLLARAFCHEIDHLNGVLYIDKARKVYKLEE
jgi:peptide deformylase